MESWTERKTRPRNASRNTTKSSLESALNEYHLIEPVTTESWMTRPIGTRSPSPCGSNGELSQPASIVASARATARRMVIAWGT